jgi:DNA-binding winged helix-turn-helix (wHTH) protein
LRVTFGDYMLDSGARQVTRHGRVLTLSPKAFDLLTVLIERRPAIVKRPELQDRLWPKTAVAYTSLARVVSELRRALGDDGQEPCFIRTAYGFGYAFCGEALDLEARGEKGTTCRLIWDERVIELEEGVHVIGRGSDCSIRIVRPNVSRRHARIVVAQSVARIEDLGSKNGTFVAGRRLASSARLSDGDQIVLGLIVLVFRTGEDMALAPTD